MYSKSLTPKPKPKPTPGQARFVKANLNTIPRVVV